MASIAIVGGGVAGLATAYALRETDAEVTVYEAGRSIGGRVATRRRNGCVYDVGANYLKDDDPRVAELVTDDLADGLVEAEGPVWTFDADGEIAEGRGDGERKWTYREGLVELADHLRAVGDATVRTDSEVEALARSGEEWRVHFGDEAASADAVVLTPPAPATAYLLDRSEWDDLRREELRDAAAAVPYRTVLSVALHYSYRTETPYYALVNTDKEHDLGWVAREECKPDHVPDGESLLVVQPSPAWSRERYEADDDEVAVAAADLAAELLGDPDRYQFDWADVVRWRDALPDAGADREALARGADVGLFFAGDWVVGEGRAHAALRSGLETGHRVRESIT
ncbi:NAD/FAD-dependent oxidoreductase [Halobacteriales archaeon QS_1_67_19]|nr:MAG: NAD/FAD-dependent oxidoreductase [Halobacteriales archaeon QS_1_67_19]